MTKRNLSFLASVLILLVVVAGGYYLYRTFTASRIYISKFTGNLLSVQGETVTLRGVFYSDSGVPEDLSADVISPSGWTAPRSFKRYSSAGRPKKSS